MNRHLGKQMRKVLPGIVLSAALILQAAPFQAEEEKPLTIAETVQAPERWEETLPGGNEYLQLYMDADIVVPDAFSVAVAEAYEDPFTEEEALGIIEDFFHEDPRFYETRQIPSYSKTELEAAIALMESNVRMMEESGEDLTNAFFYQMTKDQIESCKAMLETAPEEGVFVEKELAFSEIEWESGEKEVQFSGEAVKDGYTYYIFAEPENVQFAKVPTVLQMLPPCTISEEQALDYANAYLAELGIEDEFALVKTEEEETSDRDGGMYRRSWKFLFKRVIGTVAENPSNYVPTILSGEQVKIQKVYDYESLTIAADDKGVCGISWKNRCRIGDIIAEDVELLPFEQIQDVCRSIAEEKMAETKAREDAWAASHPERASEKEVVKSEGTITELRFGYMRMSRMMEDGSISYLMIPVWDFSQGGEQYTVNAIDGSILRKAEIY